MTLSQPVIEAILRRQQKVFPHYAWEKYATIYYVNINARIKAKIQLKENVNKICSNAVNWVYGWALTADVS